VDFFALQSGALTGIPDSCKFECIMKFAVIQTGGKQYRVSPDQKLQIERLPDEVGKKITFDSVLLVSDGSETQVGTPSVKGAVVEAEILRAMRERKKIVFKYHNKTRYRKKKGHRQEKTEIKILAIK